MSVGFFYVSCSVYNIGMTQERCMILIEPIRTHLSLSGFFMLCPARLAVAQALVRSAVQVDICHKTVAMIKPMQAYFSQPRLFMCQGNSRKTEYNSSYGTSTKAASDSRRAASARLAELSVG